MLWLSFAGYSKSITVFNNCRLVSATLLAGASATLDDTAALAAVDRVESIADVRALLRQLQRESLAKKPAAIVRGPFLAEMLLDASMLQVQKSIVARHSKCDGLQIASRTRCARVVFLCMTMYSPASCIAVLMCMFLARVASMTVFLFQKSFGAVIDAELPAVAIPLANALTSRIIEYITRVGISSAVFFDLQRILASFLHPSVWSAAAVTGAFYGRLTPEESAL